MKLISQSINVCVKQFYWEEKHKEKWQIKIIWLYIKDVKIEMGKSRQQKTKYPD